MIELIKDLAMLWGAFFIVFLLHELGHLPTAGIKIHRWFPLPVMSSRQALSRIGGLVVNLGIVIAVFNYQPENPFLQIIGAVAFFHLIYYLIVGSFYPEPKVPKRFWHLVVFDDVDNNYWYIFVPMALYLIFRYGSFYIEIFRAFVGGLL